MLFNSFSFAIFYPIIFILYWFVFNKSFKIQNILLLAASYYFYACWDWRFLFLLLFSTVLDYYTGLKIEEATSQKVRKVWLWISVGTNLGFLGFFKYYNFFAESFADFLSVLGFQVNPWTLAIILPVGISFYTFHGLSYVIDIYLNRIKAERNFIDYGLFVSFFPLLVAGPIERATHLLPQLKRERIFTYEKGVDGAKQILWGLFKKVVVADNCAPYITQIFDNSADLSGSTLVLGIVLFSFQVYGDFSGYSDIALGTARLLGVELLKNFNYPYFSRDIPEIWRRWHISLFSWFRDYVYIPLGGSKGGTWFKVKNTMIIFVVSGFWHGASWNYVLWGTLNGLYMLPSIIFNSAIRDNEIVAKGRWLPTLKELGQMLLAFSLFTSTFVIFRTYNMEHAWEYAKGIADVSLFTIPSIFPKKVFFFIALLMIVEWLGREHNYALENIENKLPRVLRYAFYYFIIFLLFWFAGADEQFIYFQF